MFKFWWPIGLIILSSVGYQVGLKEVSTGMDPFVALVVTYLVASAVSFAIYFIQGTGKQDGRRTSSPSIRRPSVLALPSSASSLGTSTCTRQAGPSIPPSSCRTASSSSPSWSWGPSFTEKRSPRGRSWASSFPWQASPPSHWADKYFRPLYNEIRISVRRKYGHTGRTQ